MRIKPFFSKNLIRLTTSALALSIAAPLSTGLPNQTLYANDQVLVTNDKQILNQVYPDQHFLVELKGFDDPAISRITLDASQIGASNKIDIPLELMVVSISANQAIEAGDYFLPVVATDEDGGIIKEIDYPVTILANELPDHERRDWEEEVIYFLLTDRFYDGQADNNNPYDLAYAEADNPRGTYQGGDFAGVTEKLDYLAELGVTTIWLSPIVANIQYDVSAGTTDGAFYGYHGYWAENFEELNPHFGSLEDFHKLIDAAAEQDIKIMVDVVLNHTGYGLHPDDGKGESQVEGYPTEEDRAVFSDMIRLTPGNDSVSESLSGLPDLLTEDPDVREQIVAWQTAWLDMATTENGHSIASFRVDTAIHVDTVTLKHFRNQLTEKNPDFKLIAEAWGADPINHKHFLTNGMMDSVLDFKFKETARNFVNGNLVGANEQLIKRNEAMTSNATGGQFLSSHDETGFLYMLNNHLGKYQLAASLQLTAKGQPVIYYGEELAQTGANNWPIYDNRYDLDWEVATAGDNATLTHYQTVLDFRHQFSDSLSKGERQLLAGSNAENYILVARNYQDESVYLLFSKAEEATDITLELSEADALVTDHYTGETYQAQGTRIRLPLPLLENGGTGLLTLDKGHFINQTDN